MDLRYQQCYHNHFPNTAQFDACIGETVSQVPNKVTTDTKAVNEINQSEKKVTIQESEPQEIPQKEKTQEVKQEEQLQGEIEELSHLIKAKEDKNRMGLLQTIKFLYFHFLIPNVDNLLKFTLLILILLLGQNLYL